MVEEKPAVKTSLLPAGAYVEQSACRTGVAAIDQSPEFQRMLYTSRAPSTTPRASDRLPSIAVGPPHRSRSNPHRKARKRPGTKPEMPACLDMAQKANQMSMRVFESMQCGNRELECRARAAYDTGSTRQTVADLCSRSSE